MLQYSQDGTTLTFQGFTYSVARMLARDGTVFAMRTSVYLFPFYAELQAAAELVKAGKPVTDSALGPTLFRLIRAVQGDEVDHLNNVLGALTQVSWEGEGGRPYTKTLDKEFFNTHFQDRYDAWIEWAVFALKVQLRSFFVGASKLGGMLQSQVGPQVTTTDEPSSSSQKGAERTG